LGWCDKAAVELMSYAGRGVFLIAVYRCGFVVIDWWINLF
jgi:hypothetical protein